MTASAAANLPKAHFPVRRMDFSFDATQKYWWSGDPFMSHFMNNLSSLFPYGEKFFVDSVRGVRDQIDDPQLQKDISAFIGQEAMHSKEHATYNDYAAQHGIDLERLELRIKVLLEWVTRFTTKKQRLAATCALEHFTATMAEQLLRREDLSTQMDDQKMYQLWMWHAIEENEHKAVCYDAYMAVGGGYFERTITMALTTVMFIGVIGAFQLHLLRKDGQHSVHSAPVPWTTKLRVNLPQAPREEKQGAQERRPRRMIVSGHEAVYDTALALA